MMKCNNWQTFMDLNNTRDSTVFNQGTPYTPRGVKYKIGDK